MRATTLAVAALLALGLIASFPTVSAEEDRHCIQDCNWLENLVWDTLDNAKRTAKELTAPPCTCDPMPNPGP